MDWTLKRKKKKKRKKPERWHSNPLPWRRDSNTLPDRINPVHHLVPTHPRCSNQPTPLSHENSRAKNFAKPLLKPNTAEQLGSTTSVQCHVVRNHHVSATQRQCTPRCHTFQREHHVSANTWRSPLRCVACSAPGQGLMQPWKSRAKTGKSSICRMLEIKHRQLNKNRQQSN